MPHRALLLSSWPAAVVGAVGTLLVLLRFDVPPVALAAYLVYLLVAVAFPGVVVWRLLLARLHGGPRPPTWFEDLTLGTVFGFTLQLPFFLLGVATALPVLVLVPPLLALVLSLTPRGRRSWSLPTGRLHPGAAWGLAATTLYGLFWLNRNAFPLRPLWLPRYKAPNIDETFHQALISDIANRFPPEIPHLLGTRLDYHWFVHAQIAASNSLTPLGSVEMLRLVMPTLVLVLAVLGLGAVALRLTGRPVAAFVAPVLLVAGSYHLIGPGFDTRTFYEPYLTTRFVSSPSQAYGVMISMPALMLLLEVLRPRTRPPAAVWAALAVALLGLSGAKATFIPVFVCGAIGVWAVHLLLNRRVHRPASMLLLLLVSVFLFAQLVIFGGQTGGMEVAPFKTVGVALRSNGLPLTPPYVTLMTVVLLVGWLLYGVGGVGLKKRLVDPRAVWLLVAVPAGITVPFLLYRTGLSQLWFSRTVAELVVLLSAWGFASVLPRPLRPRSALRYGGLAVVAGTTAFAVSLLVQNLQGTSNATRASLLLTVLVPAVLVAGFLLLRLAPWKAPRPPLAMLLSVLLGLGFSNVVSEGYDVVTGAGTPGPSPGGGRALFAPGGAEAARYIAKHSPKDAVVATNVHCVKPKGRCDNRSFWVTAYTQRRVVVEGWGYTAATNETARQGVANAHLPIPFPERLAVNDALFTDPSRETLTALVEAYGVDWLFVSRKYDADTDGLDALSRRSDLLARVFENKNYVVYKVDG